MEKIEELQLPNTICIKLDVTNLEMLHQAVQTAEETYGQVDALVNNAGVMFIGDIYTQDPLEWKRMFDINVLGVLNGVHAVINQMIHRNHGTIINISSLAGKKTFPHYAAYVGTKFAVHGMSETIREEVTKYNVRVITIAPGVVATELADHVTSDEHRDSHLGWAESLDGGLQAIDVANAILFAYYQPQNVNIREIVLAATKQES